jgi:hypothetical protein
MMETTTKLRLAELDPAGLEGIPNLVRCEKFNREAMGERITELTHTVYPHEQVYGPFITIHEHIDCPPEKVFAYMANPYSLMEWTYSVRELRPAGRPDLLVGVDSGRTPIYCKTLAHEDALTVDYHCAWDQGERLWMIYLMRVVPAELVLNRPGSVVLWTNCKHPYYEVNPFPERAPAGRDIWVGDIWPFFYAGHYMELQNLKLILEHRHAHGLPIMPEVTP